MKHLIIGAFLLFAFTAQAQQFVNSEKALSIINDVKISGQEVYDLVDDPIVLSSQLYVIKINAYQILGDLLQNESVEVEAAVKQTVMEVQPTNVPGAARTLDITDEEYDSDTINDLYLKWIKTHLITLLAE